MKNIRKIIYSILCVSLLISCETTELTDLLDNPNGVNPENISVNFGTDGIQIALATMFQNSQIVGGQATRMNYMFGPNYLAAFAPDTGVNAWNTAYASILNDSQFIIPKAQSFDAGYQEGIIRIAKAYALMTLVDLWGDVPFTEALQGNENFNPELTDGVTVYAAALEELNLAITAIESDLDLALAEDTVPTTFEDFNTIPGGGSPNNFFFPNAGTNQILIAQQWIKFANSLKFRYFLNIGDVANINTLIAEGNLLTDGNADNFAFTYGTSTNPESRHPLYVRDYGDGNPNDYMSNSYMFAMVGSDDAGGNDFLDSGDPRWPFYFKRQVLAFPTSNDNPSLGDALPCADNASPYGPGEAFCSFGPGFWGRDHHNADGIPPDADLRTVYGSYPIGGLADDGGPDNIADGDGLNGEGIAPIFMSFQLDLMRAEAALTLGTNDDDVAFLTTGIEKSIAYVSTFGGGAAADSANYVTAVLTAYNAADNDGKLQIIAQQMWFASFGSGLEMYNTYRRTGKPDNLQRSLLLDGGGDFPRSLFYPTSTANLNISVDQKSDLTQSVFWADPSIPLQ